MRDPVSDSVYYVHHRRYGDEAIHYMMSLSLRDERRGLADPDSLTAYFTNVWYLHRKRGVRGASTPRRRRERYWGGRWSR